MNAQVIPERVHYDMFTVFQPGKSLSAVSMEPACYDNISDKHACEASDRKRDSGVSIGRPEKWSDLFFSDFAERVVL